MARESGSRRLRGGDLQVDRLGPEGATGSLVDLASDPVMGTRARPPPPARPRAGRATRARPSAGGPSGLPRTLQGATRTRGSLRMRLTLGDVSLAAGVELPVVEPEPHRRRYRLPAAPVRHQQAVLMALQVFESPHRLLLPGERVGGRVSDPVVEAIGKRGHPGETRRSSLPLRVRLSRKCTRSRLPGAETCPI